jgi:hypothetical protein
MAPRDQSPLGALFLANWFCIAPVMPKTRCRPRSCNTLTAWRLSSSRFSKSPTSPSSTAILLSEGLASIVAGNSHKRLEVGLIGSEGMTGLPIVLGNDRSPHENFIQVAGEGSRILADKLREAMRQSRSLEKVFLRFAHSFMNQTANTAFSNGTATLEERLARWLLMANDRLEGDEIPLTHEFLSLMLGVRRAGGYGRPALSGKQGSHSALPQTHHRT